MSVLFVALTALLGCAEAPVFQDITGVTIHTQTAAGTARKSLEGKELQEATRCLYSTANVTEADLSPDLLGSILIIEVKDRYGDRMFELFTAENLKGNKGRFFQNPCIYEVLENNR